MKLIHRKIDFSQDKKYVMECHCKINYACDTPWAREASYEEYRRNWFSWPSQTEGFLNALTQTAQDDRTIAEIIETETGERIGYLWVPFTEDCDTGFVIAEVQDIFVEEPFRKNGVATDLYHYAGSLARRNGAQVFRAGTGCENRAAIELHKKLGFYPYRYEFEKKL